MTHIQQRRGTSVLWTSTNPVMYDGEAGHETDTGRWKLGDGVTAWNALPYKAGVDSVAGKTGEVELVVEDVDGAAPLVSPAFTGGPTAPTPATSDNDTSIATTAYVKNQLNNTALTGTPTAPTPAAADNDTSIATTKFVKDQNYRKSEAGSFVATVGTSFVNVGFTAGRFSVPPAVTVSASVGTNVPLSVNVEFITAATFRVYIYSIETTPWTFGSVTIQWIAMEKG